MHRFCLPILLAATAAALSAQSVTVTPANESVITGGSKQYTATVTGLSPATVTWTVNGIPGGNSTLGTVDMNGLFTAPMTAPSPQRSSSPRPAQRIPRSPVPQTSTSGRPDQCSRLSPRTTCRAAISPLA